MDALQRIAVLFESFAPQDLRRLHDYYRADARFEDPLHAVQGLEAIGAVYRHMFEAMDGPRFAVTQRFSSGDHGVLLWDFRFRLRRLPGAGELCMKGASHLLLDTDGRIALHRDYWDAAGALYEKLPVAGALVRWLRRRAAA